MSAFGKYFGRLLKVLWEDIVDFFKLIIDLFVSIWRSLVSNFSYYKSVFDLYSQDFDAMGWIFFVLSILLVLALIGGLVFLIVKLSKRSYIARRKVKDKIVLLREIDRLNNKVIDLMDERSQLLSLKVAELGYAPTKEDIKNMENARKKAEEAANNPEEVKTVGFKFKVDKKGRPVFGKNGFPEIELEYKKDEEGNVLLDENKKPIPLIEFKKDKKGKFLFDANGYPIPEEGQEGINEEGVEGEQVDAEVVDEEDDGRDLGQRDT